MFTQAEINNVAHKAAEEGSITVVRACRDAQDPKSPLHTYACGIVQDLVAASRTEKNNTPG